MLCRTVGRTVGTRLFTRINSYDSLPERLLRPPPGWPDDFQAAIAGLPPEEQRILDLLGPGESSELTYRDIYELLCKELSECEPGNAFLLGSHGPEQREDDLLKEAVRRIVEGWPPPPFRIAGRDEGRSAENFWLRPAENSGRAFQKAFERVLRKCGIHAGRGPAVYRRQMTSCPRTVESVLPDARDRRVPALRSVLGQAPLFYRSELSERRPRPLRVPVVHLYLDVSGSMTECLPYLSAACREPFKRGELKVFAFSTVVSELKGHDLSKAPMQNTWGTEPEHRHRLRLRRRADQLSACCSLGLGELGRRLFVRLRGDADLSATFGPDFKVLASLEVKPGKNWVEWRRLILSIQHIPKLSYERQHRIVLPLLEQILRDLEAGGLEGAASTFTSDKLLLNAAGEFAIGGPEGDNGLSGKKLVIDHYGPSVPIGGEALSGKDPHKVDKCGALRARQLAKKLVRGGVDEARVLLGWTPGGDTPFLVEASTSQGSVNLQVPRGELPSDEWFSIKAIVRDLELAERDWSADLRGGYFCQASAPWER